MIRDRTFNTVPGAFQISHFSLRSRRILGVKRNGVGLDSAGINPGNREFFYTAGRIVVDDTNPFEPGEKMWVLYDN